MQPKRPQKIQKAIDKGLYVIRPDDRYMECRRNFQIYKINDLYHFLLHLFFISGWGFQEGSSFNNPVWSVSVELVIYVFFFISIFYLDKYKIKFAVSVYILLLIIDKFGISGNYPEPKTFFFDCAKLFFSGIIVFFLYQNFKKKLYLIAISILLISLSFVGNFKAFLFFPSVLLLFAGLEMFIYQTKTNILYNYFIYY